MKPSRFALATSGTVTGPSVQGFAGAGAAAAAGPAGAGAAAAAGPASSSAAASARPAAAIAARRYAAGLRATISAPV